MNKKKRNLMRMQMMHFLQLIMRKRMKIWNSGTITIKKKIRKMKMITKEIKNLIWMLIMKVKNNKRNNLKQKRMRKSRKKIKGILKILNKWMVKVIKNYLMKKKLNKKKKKTKSKLMKKVFLFNQNNFNRFWRRRWRVIGI